MRLRGNGRNFQDSRRLLAVLGMPLVLCTASQNTPEPPALFRSDVQLVRLEVDVTRKGKRVEGLKREDFLIWEDTQQREVAYFGEDEVPLDVILLLDTSKSMQDAVSKVVESTQKAFSLLRPGDRVGAISFSFQPRVILPFTRDLKTASVILTATIQETRFYGATHVQLAAEAAARYFLQQPPASRRRAIIFVTDNEGQRTSVQQVVIQKLNQAEAVVSALVLKDRTGILRRPRMRRGWEIGVDEFVQATGGEMLQAKNASQALSQLLSLIRRRYVLYFPMPPHSPGSFHPVQVALSSRAAAKHPKAQVRTRLGYVVPSR